MINSRRMSWDGDVAHTGEKINAYKILVYSTKPEGNSPLGIRRRYWENNTKIDLKNIGWRNVEWIHVALDRVQ
jgi:hypothetical protein